MTEDEELDTWRRDWQSMDLDDAFLRELTARVTRDGRRMRREALMQVAAAIFSTSVCAFITIRSRGAPVVVALSGFILFFNGAYLTQYFSARASLDRAAGLSASEFVALTRKRMDAEFRTIRFTLRWVRVIAIVLVPWSVWMFAAHAAVYRSEPWRAAVGFGGAIAILGVSTALVRRRRAILSRESAAFEKQLEE